ncbi:regulator, partial [Streptomyces sp. NPDC059398]
MGNLPVVATSFVGRTGQLRRAARALEKHRLVTLTGGGGVGKSRLALRAAEEAGDGYADGVWWADLSHLCDERLLIGTVSDAVGLLDHDLARPVEALCERLADRNLLLVLDCCERILAACGDLVGALLRAAPGLSVLATSREPLGVPGEYLLDVPPLAGVRHGGDGQRVLRRGRPPAPRP